MTFTLVSYSFISLHSGAFSCVTWSSSAQLLHKHLNSYRGGVSTHSFPWQLSWRGPCGLVKSSGKCSKWTLSWDCFVKVRINQMFIGSSNKKELCLKEDKGGRKRGGGGAGGPLLRRGGRSTSPNYIHEEESLKLHESRCKVYLYPECITLQHTHTHFSFRLPVLSSRLLNIWWLVWNIKHTHTHTQNY